MIKKLGINNPLNYEFSRFIKPILWVESGESIVVETTYLWNFSNISGSEVSFLYINGKYQSTNSDISSSKWLKL